MALAEGSVAKADSGYAVHNGSVSTLAPAINASPVALIYVPKEVPMHVLSLFYEAAPRAGNASNVVIVDAIAKLVVSTSGAPKAVPPMRLEVPTFVPSSIGNEATAGIIALDEARIVGVKRAAKGAAITHPVPASIAPAPHVVAKSPAITPKALRHAIGSNAALLKRDAITAALEAISRPTITNVPIGPEREVVSAVETKAFSPAPYQVRCGFVAKKVRALPVDGLVTFNNKMEAGLHTLCSGTARAQKELRIS